MRGAQDQDTRLPAYTISRNIYCESATIRNEPHITWPVFPLKAYSMQTLRGYKYVYNKYVSWDNKYTTLVDRLMRWIIVSSS